MAGKWQLGNTRGRTEGKEQTENGEGAEGGLGGADGEFRAKEGCMVWGCSLFPGTPTTAHDHLLIIGKVCLLLQTAVAKLYISDNWGGGAYNQQQGSLSPFLSPLSSFPFFFKPCFPHTSQP